MRRQIQDEHVNHERWLVSYSDFVTLLFAFFVVMYSLSQLSDGEFEDVASVLSQQFANTTVVSNKLDTNDVGPTAVVATLQGEDFVADEGNVELTPSDLKESPISVNGMPLSLQTLEKDLRDDLQASLQDGRVGILGNEQWLDIDVGTDALFAVGSAKLSSAGRLLFNLIAIRLKDMTNAVRVEGFTSDMSSTESSYDSPWALSAARAASVAQVLQENGVQPHRIAAVGYGSYQPLTSNESVLGQAVNRRVVISVSADAHPRPGRAGIAYRVIDESAQNEAVVDQPYRSWIDEVSAALGKIKSDPQQETTISMPEGVNVSTTEAGGILITRDDE